MQQRGSCRAHQERQAPGEEQRNGAADDAAERDGALGRAQDVSG